MFKRFSILGNLALACAIVFSMINSTSAAALSIHHDAKMLSQTAIPVKFSLTAKPGETVSQQFRLPVSGALANGTTSIGYKIITLTITNSQQAVAARSTSKICSGDMNSVNGRFTSQVNWHYDGTYAYHDSNKAKTWLPLNGFSKGTYTGLPANPTGGSTEQFVSTLASFVRGNNTEWHSIVWILYGNGNCTATGSIFSQ